MDNMHFSGWVGCRVKVLQWAWYWFRTQNFSNRTKVFKWGTGRASYINCPSGNRQSGSVRLLQWPRVWVYESCIRALTVNISEQGESPLATQAANARRKEGKRMEAWGKGGNPHESKSSGNSEEFRMAEEAMREKDDCYFVFKKVSRGSLKLMGSPISSHMGKGKGRGVTENTFSWPDHIHMLWDGWGQ